MFGWLRSIYGANPSRMRALSGLTLDLAPRQPSIGNRCLLAGAYLIMLLLVALPALCPAMGSGAGVAGTALVEPVVSAVHPASTATDVVDRFDAQSAASWQLNPDQDHRASSTSMQAGDNVDPDDDGLSLALASSSRLLSLPTGALAPRPDPRRPLDRTEAPPDRPPTPAS